LKERKKKKRKKKTAPKKKNVSHLKTKSAYIEGITTRSRILPHRGGGKQSPIIGGEKEKRERRLQGKESILPKKRFEPEKKTRKKS